jgi:hypothetical protein
VRERWGALSVRDHIDAAALAIDLLLYDRLIFPTPASWDIDRWRDEGWQPELQRTLMERLGPDVAMARPWDVAALEVYADVLRQLRLDAQQMAAESEPPAYLATRRALAHGTWVALPKDADIRPIAVYRSAEEFVSGVAAVNRDEGRARTSLLLGARLLAFGGDPMDALDRSLRLTRQAEFRAQRRAFYEWQDVAVSRIADGDLTVEAAATQMTGRVQAYNALVERAGGAKRSKLIYVVANLAAGAAAVAGGVAGAPLIELIGGVLAGSASVVQYLHLDRAPPPATDGSAPEAMFHVAGSERAE